MRNILDFPGTFRPPAEIVTLDRNYRSTQPILAAANGVIKLATERFTKNLWTDRQSSERPWLVSVRDEADQVGYIVERVLENREVGTSLRQQAALFRTSHHSAALAIELTRRNIPSVKFGGLKFSTPRTSRICSRCCGSSGTPATGSRAFVSCNCYPAWDRRRRTASSTG